MSLASLQNRGRGRTSTDSLICLQNNRLLRFLSKLKPRPETDRTKFWASTQPTEGKAGLRCRKADAGAPGFLARPPHSRTSDRTPECRAAAAHVSRELSCPAAWVVRCPDHTGELQALALTNTLASGKNISQLQTPPSNSIPVFLALPSSL